MSGILWFAFAIPVILIAVLLGIPSLRKRTVWWEMAIPIGVTILTVVLCQWIAVRSAINDKEYWGHMSYTITHKEPFTYDGECSRQYACGIESYSCGTSKKPRTCTRTKYCTDYYRCDKESSRSCYITDDRGQTYRISYGKYKELDKRWENYKHTSKKIITKKSADGTLYTTIGDKYKKSNRGHRHIVFWPGDAKSSEPIVKEYTYENRLQTQSHWGRVSEEDRKLYDIFEYPSVPGGWRLQALLTNGPTFREADHHLQYLNGYLNTNKGGYKKVRLWVLIFNEQPQESAELQRSHWKGGNKNELIIMFGTNKEKAIIWADIMAQTDDATSEALKISIRDEILLKMADGEDGYTGKLDDKSMLKFVTWVGDSVKSSYTKPDFRQYAYIQVQPSFRAIIISYIIIILVNLGAGAFVVYNPWQESMKHTMNHRRWR